MIASVVMKAAVVERPDTQSAHVPGSIHVLSPTSPIDCNLSPSIGAPILLRRRHGVQPGDDHALRLIIPAERCALRASACGTTAYLSWDALALQGLRHQGRRRARRRSGPESAGGTHGDGRG